MFHFHKILGKIQFTACLVWNSIGFWVGFAGFTGSVVLLMVNPHLTELVKAIMMISLLLSVVQIIVDLSKMRSSVTRYSFKKRGKEHLDRLTLPSSYQGVEKIGYSKGIAIYNKELNRHLVSERLKFHIEKSDPRYSLRNALDYIFLVILYHWFTEKKKILFNNRKVRLKSDLLVSGSPFPKSVCLQETNYFSSVCSNEQTMTTITDSRTDFDIFNGFEFAFPGQVVPMMETSRCANQIGISTLAITSDGKIILGYQSTRSAQSSDCLTCSGSGSADYRDLGRKRGSFSSFLIRAMERELLEECGLKRMGFGIIHPDKPRNLQTKVIGFARLLERGGKPEFFGVTKLAVPSARIRRKGAERYYGQPFSQRDFIDIYKKTPKEVCAVLEEFLVSSNEIVSPSLYINISFLKEYFEHYSEDAEKVLV